MTYAPTMDRDAAASEGPTRELPSNLPAEQALLGAVMYDNAAYDRADDLEPAEFREPGHQRLWAAIGDALRRGASAEPILLSQQLAADPALQDLAQGPVIRYLADLVDVAPPVANVRDYARSIRETHRLRELIRIGEIILTEAGGGVEKPMTAQEQVERAEAALFALGEGKETKSGFQPFKSAVRGFMDQVRTAYASPGGVGGVPTHLADLDAKVGGLFPSDLIVLAGRPSMGKTALATNIAFNVARRYASEAQPDGAKKTVAGGVVAFFSLEMSAEQLAGRIVCDVAGVSSDRVRKNQVSDVEIGRMTDVERELSEIPLWIDATGGISIAKLSARARRLKRQHGLDMIVVDYLQLATGTDRSKGGGRVQEVSEITTGLKALAKDLDVPIIALSQLSRQVEQRDDKRPQLSDLRESGSIEQDADQVWFVYREAYYVARAEPREGTPEHLNWQEQLDALEGLAEVIVAKQRHGPIGSVKLAFNSDYTRFSDLARDQHFAQARERTNSVTAHKAATLPYRDDE